MKFTPLTDKAAETGEEKELTPDLEWILQSGQVDLPDLARLLVREQFTPIYTVAVSILEDPGLAYCAVFDALIGVLSNLHQVQNGDSARAGGVHIWLYRRVLEVIAAIRRQASLRHSLRFFLPFHRESKGDKPVLPYARLNPEIETERETAIGTVLASLPERRRLALVLVQLYGWPVAEAASLLNTPQRDLAAWLTQDRRRLEEALPAQLHLGKEQPPAAEERIQAALRRRWSPPAITPAGQDTIAAEILWQVRQTITRRKRFTSLKELIWLAAVLPLVFGLLWWAGSLEDQEPVSESHPRSSPVAKQRNNQPTQTITAELHHTLWPGDTLDSIADLLGIPADELLAKVPALHQPLEVGKMLRIPIDPYAPRPRPVPIQVRPLTIGSTDAAIRQRLAENYRLWHSFWGDARIVYYGPPGYVGPFPGSRSQVWLYRPLGQSLVINAPLNEPPFSAVLVDDFIVASSDLVQKHTAYRLSPNLGLPLQLLTMLFPHQSDWLSRDGSFQASEFLEIQGRQTLIVDWFNPAGILESRLWVDAYTGIILRQQQMAETGDGALVADFQFTRFAIDAAFPPDVFRLEENQEFGFVDRIDQLPQAAPIPPAGAHPIPGRPRLSKDLAVPPGFDLSRSSLNFDFWSNYGEHGALITSLDAIVADLYATGRYPPGQITSHYLGTVPFGHPFGPLVCDRSPDGQRIAYTSQEWTAHLRWFSLSDLQAVHDPLPDERPHELAFAPAGSRLAVSASEKWSANKDNRIFILDTDSGEVRELGKTAYPASSLVWSPDGRYLSFLDLDPFDEPPKQNELVVLEVETGEKVYSSPVTLAFSQASNPALGLPLRAAAPLPADWPGHEWGVEFPITPRGLEDCAAPPDPSPQLAYPSGPLPAGQALIGVRTPINRYRNQVTLFSANPAFHNPAFQDPPTIAAAWIEPVDQAGERPASERRMVFMDSLSQAFSGDRIGFVMQRSLYLLDMDGSPPRRIAGPFEHPISAAWSPDGRYVALSFQHDDGHSDLYVLDLACAEQPEGCQDELSGDGNARGMEISRMDWSPGSRRFTFEMWDYTGRKHLFMADMQASPEEPQIVGLTAGTTWGGTNAHWLPDGQGLIFLAVRPVYPCRANLMRVGLLGAEPEVILPDLSCAAMDFAVSPDGQTLAFVAPYLFNTQAGDQVNSQRPNPSIWLWRIGDEDLSDLTRIEAPEDSQGRLSSPVFSPDGKFLLFKTGTEQVMRLDLRSKAVRTLFEIPQGSDWDTPWFWPRIYTIHFPP